MKQPLPKKIAGSLVAAGFVSACAAPLATVECLPGDDVWRQLPAHRLVLPQDRQAAGRTLQGESTCRFFYSEGVLYLAADLDDSCIATFGVKNGDDLYYGDCFEVFIKPDGQPFYWEIWISPAGFRSVVKWRKKNDLESQSHLIEGREVQVAVTIREPGSTERPGWSLKAAIPLPDVPGLEPGAWRLLIAQQNYDETLSQQTRELSSFPQLSRASFHLTEEYLKLQ